MLTRRRRADMSKYEILGILLEKGLTIPEIAKTCRLSVGWTWLLLQRLGYYRVWVWRKRRKPKDVWPRRDSRRRHDLPANHPAQSRYYDVPYVEPRP